MHAYVYLIQIVKDAHISDLYSWAPKDCLLDRGACQRRQSLRTNSSALHFYMHVHNPTSIDRHPSSPQHALTYRANCHTIFRIPSYLSFVSKLSVCFSRHLSQSAYFALVWRYVDQTRLSVGAHGGQCSDRRRSNGVRSGSEQRLPHHGADYTRRGKWNSRRDEGLRRGQVDPRAKDLSLGLHDVGTVPYSIVRRPSSSRTFRYC